MLKKITGLMQKGKVPANFISIKLPSQHKMVLIARLINWAFLIDMAMGIRRQKKIHLGGPKPNFRALLGALLVRIVTSCTLREAEDYIRCYAPARYLCGLESGDWTPNFRTISDFEIMLGAEGLQTINNYVLNVAKEAGFLDIKGLCADTTAQEALIPYPTEVGLMNSFAKSIETGITTLGQAAQSIGSRATKIIDSIKKEVRKCRLFAKKKAEKKAISESILANTKRLVEILWQLPILNDGGVTLKKSRGIQRRTAERLPNLLGNMEALIPQIQHFLRTGRVVKGKIVSLYLEGVHSIVRGKAGKNVEFGLKWGINQIRGGYVSLFFLTESLGEADFAVEAVRHHINLFGAPPQDFGYDRGGWSKAHIKKLRKMQVKNIAIAPKGKAKWKVGVRKQKQMVNERAQVEGKIGTLKAQGFNKPPAKTTGGMRRSAYRSALRFNIGKLVRDLQFAEVKVA